MEVEKAVQSRKSHYGERQIWALIGAGVVIYYMAISMPYLPRLQPANMDLVHLNSVSHALVLVGIIVGYICILGCRADPWFLLTMAGVVVIFNRDLLFSSRFWHDLAVGFTLGAAAYWLLSLAGGFLIGVALGLLKLAKSESSYHG